MSNLPPLLTPKRVFLGVGLYGYFFCLFWVYLPFAIAALVLR